LAEVEKGLLQLAIDVASVDPNLEELCDHVTIYAVVRGKYRSRQKRIDVTYVPDATTVKVEVF